MCPKGSGPHFAAKQGRSFRVAALSWVLSLRIEKWTLECSCVPKGVAATFCSKTRPFFSCACSKPSGVHVCPRRSRPYSAAKQGRSFRVAKPGKIGLILQYQMLFIKCAVSPGLGANLEVPSFRFVWLL